MQRITTFPYQFSERKNQSFLRATFLPQGFCRAEQKVFLSSTALGRFKPRSRVQKKVSFRPIKEIYYFVSLLHYKMLSFSFLNIFCPRNPLSSTPISEEIMKDEKPSKKFAEDKTRKVFKENHKMSIFIIVSNKN